MSSGNRSQRHAIDGKLLRAAHMFRSWLRLPAVASGKIKGQSEAVVEKAKETIELESQIEGDVRDMADSLSYRLYANLCRNGEEQAWWSGVRALYLLDRRQAFDMVDREVARRSMNDAVYAPLLALARLLTEKGKGRNERAGKFIPAVKFDGWDLEKPEEAARRLFGAMLTSSNKLLGEERVRNSIIGTTSGKLAKAGLLTPEQLLGMVLTVFGEKDKDAAGLIAQEFVDAGVLTGQAADACVEAYNAGHREEAPADAAVERPEAETSDKPPAE